MLFTFLTSLALLLQGWFGWSAEIVPDNTLVLGTTTGSVVRVIDGDTIEVRLTGATEVVRVRYIGIDTPEPYATAISECGSAAASDRNAELVTGKIVTLVPGITPYDAYGRLLAYVYVDAIFVNQALIAEGFATVLMIAPNTTYRSQFTELYTNARSKQLGIWGQCDKR